MRNAPLAVLGAAALATPAAGAAAAATARKAVKTKTSTVTKSFTGTPGSAEQWGEVEVTLVVKKTTTTNLKTRKKTVKRHITAVHVPLYPNHTSRSIFINRRALPILVEETLRAQSARIDMVSGATYTSQGFEESLQSALVSEKHW